MKLSERLEAEADGMLPDALVPVRTEWYQLCERAGYVDKIRISGELAEAIIAAFIAKKELSREAAALARRVEEAPVRIVRASGVTAESIGGRVSAPAEYIGQRVAIVDIAALDGAAGGGDV